MRIKYELYFWEPLPFEPSQQPFLAASISRNSANVSSTSTSSTPLAGGVCVFEGVGVFSKCVCVPTSMQYFSSEPRYSVLAKATQCTLQGCGKWEIYLLVVLTFFFAIYWKN